LRQLGCQGICVKERFENDGRPQLVDALKRQEFVSGNAKLADALIKHGELVEYKKGDKLITEGGEDTTFTFCSPGRSQSS